MEKNYQNIVTATNSYLKAPTPSRPLYNFGGWNSRADGLGAFYTDGQAMNIDKDITLYAIWDATNIFLYTNGECKASEFVEDDFMCIKNDGTVHYIEFIEGSPSIIFDSTALYVSELLERTVTYLTDESDMYLIDESENYLTTII